MSDAIFFLHISPPTSLRRECYNGHYHDRMQGGLPQIYQFSFKICSKSGVVKLFHKSGK